MSNAPLPTGVNAESITRISPLESTTAADGNENGDPIGPCAILLKSFTMLRKPVTGSTLKRYPLNAGPALLSVTRISPEFSATIAGSTSLNVTVTVAVASFPGVPSLMV